MWRILILTFIDLRWAPLHLAMLLCLGLSLNRTWYVHAPWFKNSCSNFFNVRLRLKERRLVLSDFHARQCSLVIKTAYLTRPCACSNDLQVGRSACTGRTSSVWSMNMKCLPSSIMNYELNTKFNSLSQQREEQSVIYLVLTSSCNQV